jgi:hypothetical protein
MAGYRLSSLNVEGMSGHLALASYWQDDAFPGCWHLHMSVRRGSMESRSQAHNLQLIMKEKRFKNKNFTKVSLQKWLQQKPPIIITPVFYSFIFIIYDYGTSWWVTRHRCWRRHQSFGGEFESSRSGQRYAIAGGPIMARWSYANVTKTEKIKFRTELTTFLHPTPLLGLQFLGTHPATILWWPLDHPVAVDEAPATCLGAIRPLSPVGDHASNRVTAIVDCTIRVNIVIVS